MAIPQSVRSVLESGRLAHIVTLNRNGSPQVTCVWVEIDGDEIITAHLREHRKVKNLRRDNRVALSIETDRVDGQAFTPYLVVYGTAEIREGGAPEVLRRQAQVYMGPGTKFPSMDNPPAGYVTRIKPERYGGVGPWMTQGA